MFARKSTVTALAATLLLSASSGLALAQDAKAPPPPKPGPEDAPCMPPMRAGMMFKGPAGRFVMALQQFDTNKDGKISLEEAKSAENALFTAIDADKDGSLTPGEMRKYHEARMEAWKAEMPKPPEADAKGAPPPKPDDMDADNDGSDDMAQAPDDDVMPPPPPGDDACGPEMGPAGHKMHHGDHKDRHGDRKGPHRDRDRDRHGMGMRHGPMMGGMAMMRRMDTDENGQISKAEADAAVEAMFKRFDKNGDGFISADDFPKAPSILPDAAK